MLKTHAHCLQEPQEALLPMALYGPGQNLQGLTILADWRVLEGFAQVDIRSSSVLFSALLIRISLFLESSELLEHYVLSVPEYDKVSWLKVLKAIRPTV